MRIQFKPPHRHGSQAEAGGFFLLSSVPYKEVRTDAVARAPRDNPPPTGEDLAELRPAADVLLLEFLKQRPR